ncbi:carbohydrate phosphatase [Durotheca rogersii]|uniref:carbohydrate phosphatase n=1 Tax=Durotheca rogersii TaxID=419775 RepID=UPI00222047DE|nr:carbohydrate phosphatase [Durotheca rogersii]KAI5867388.1 carbohydrate phosphatase [Durotheca rogersii]
MHVSSEAARPPTSLAEHLRSAVPPQEYEGLIESVLPTLIDCVADIAQALRSSHRVVHAGGANAFGDAQLNVDVVAEERIRAALARCPFVVAASSEEDPVERATGAAPGGASGEQYAVAFDPLDGSSVAAANWAVGTIVGVWRGRTALARPPAARLVAAVLAVYGPRTTAFVALRAPGGAPTCVELGVGGARGGEVLRAQVRLAGPPPPPLARYFAPANLRAAAESPRYMALVAHFARERYTLRYSGGLVPDVAHALVKGHGIYVSPATAASPAKLRRLYELLPLALVVECAGGRAIDPADGRPVMEVPVRDTGETAGLVCGTPEDVEFVKRALLD